ncbi:MAG TPA: hypothetical protein V6D28_30710 [Leptolyngbyaceae cyanobacterium]
MSDKIEVTFLIERSCLQLKTFFFTTLGSQGTTHKAFRLLVTPLSQELIEELLNAVGNKRRFYPSGIKGYNPHTATFIASLSPPEPL